MNETVSTRVRNYLKIEKKTFIRLWQQHIKIKYATLPNDLTSVKFEKLKAHLNLYQLSIHSLCLFNQIYIFRKIILFIFTHTDRFISKILTNKITCRTLISLKLQKLQQICWNTTERNFSVEFKTAYNWIKKKN